jgi:hypothetical protein
MERAMNTTHAIIDPGPTGSLVYAKVWNVYGVQLELAIFDMPGATLQFQFIVCIPSLPSQRITWDANANVSISKDLPAGFAVKASITDWTLVSNGVRFEFQIEVKFPIYGWATVFDQTLDLPLGLSAEIEKAEPSLQEVGRLFARAHRYDTLAEPARAT